MIDGLFWITYLVYRPFTLANRYLATLRVRAQANATMLTGIDDFPVNFNLALLILAL